MDSFPANRSFLSTKHSVSLIDPYFDTLIHIKMFDDSSSF